MKFFKASAWINFHSIQLLGSSNQKLFFMKAIWKSWLWHLSISIVIGNGIAKKLFLPSDFFFKVEYLCSFLCLVIVSVPLCYKYLVLYDFLFIKSKASIGALEKSYLNIRKHPSWCFKETTASKISAYFACFPAKHPRLRSF